jgi:hypothetical protein
LCELASGKERTRFQGAGDALAFALDGRTLAAGGDDGTVRLWDLVTGKCLGQFAGHRGAVRSLAFIPDGLKLLSGSADTTALVWDVASLSPMRRTEPVALSALQLEALWADLAADPGAAYRAMQALHAAPQQAASMLQERVKPIQSIKAGQIVQWIADLDSPRFAVRKQATLELEKYGEQALPALQKALEAKPGPEKRQRLERLAENVVAGQLPPDTLRGLRAVEVLEFLGTAAARQPLEKLAKGAPEARLTREARAALGRLNP